MVVAVVGSAAQRSPRYPSGTRSPGIGLSAVLLIVSRSAHTLAIDWPGILARVLLEA
jgi:hypothetical protein